MRKFKAIVSDDHFGYKKGDVIDFEFDATKEYPYRFKNKSGTDNGLKLAGFNNYCIEIKEFKVGDKARCLVGTYSFVHKDDIRTVTKIEGKTHLALSDAPSFALYKTEHFELAEEYAKKHIATWKALPFAYSNKLLFKVVFAVHETGGKRYLFGVPSMSAEIKTGDWLYADTVNGKKKVKAVTKSFLIDQNGIDAMDCMNNSQGDTLRMITGKAVKTEKWEECEL